MRQPRPRAVLQQDILLHLCDNLVELFTTIGKVERAEIKYEALPDEPLDCAAY